MTVRKQRSLRVYSRLLRRDVARSVRKLITVKKRRGLVVIKITNPRFVTSNNYFRAWRLQRFDPLQTKNISSMVISLGLLLAGSIGIGVALLQLSSVQATPVANVNAIEATRVATKQQTQLSMDRSQPTKISIPDIQVDTSLIELGQNADGTLETPEAYDVAGWYRDSPTPGEIGPSIIVGHVDNYKGAAVFYRLKELQAGQMIAVTRSDGRTATFAVTQVAQFDQNNFPTSAVYGNIDHAGLRLITCGGPFDHATLRYTQNTVVYARLIAT